VVNLTTYQYQVGAFDKVTNESDRSAPLVFTAGLLGDANGDCSIDVSDFLTTVRLALYVDPKTYGQRDLGDMSRDGSVDVVDVVRVRNAILGRAAVSRQRSAKGGMAACLVPTGRLRIAQGIHPWEAKAPRTPPQPCYVATCQGVRKENGTSTGQRTDHQSRATCYSVVALPSKTRILNSQGRTTLKAGIVSQGLNDLVLS